MLIPEIACCCQVQNTVKNNVYDHWCKYTFTECETSDLKQLVYETSVFIWWRHQQVWHLQFLPLFPHNRILFYFQIHSALWLLRKHCCRSRAGHLTSILSADLIVTMHCTQLCYVEFHGVWEYLLSRVSLTLENDKFFRCWCCPIFLKMYWISNASGSSPQPPISHVISWNKTPVSQNQSHHLQWQNMHNIRINKRKIVRERESHIFFNECHWISAIAKH